MSGFQVTPPYGDAWAGRGLRIVRQVLEQTDADGFSAKDISAARFTYRVRAWSTGTTPALVIDQVIDKSSTDSATGWLDDYVPLGTTAYDQLRWQVVEVDGSNSDANTPTGQREVVLEWWDQAIRTKPPTA